MQAIQGTSTVEQRRSPRRNYTTTVMFENYLTGNYHDGRMVNYSRGGMCFEADVAPEVGAELFIGIEKSPYSPHHDVFRAKVVWIRELPLKESYYAYGVGVKYC
ncbi:MAG: PilZ domain-containing protein [Desulfobacterales bacterium]|nr:PilZ domain-containing protein [Desulfobacterales bacterium]